MNGKRQRERRSQSKNRGLPMVRVLLLSLPFLGVAAGFGWMITQGAPPVVEPRSSAVAAPGPYDGPGERAPWRMEGDVVYVNNTRCAQTRSQMSRDTIGKFQSRVVYDGPIETFRGKTLVFNQCCGGCAASFPETWARHRDAIMRYFGLDGRS